MPYTPEQRKAIAARMRREGKSPEEISRFFRRHGHGDSLMQAHRKRRKKG